MVWVITVGSVSWSLWLDASDLRRWEHPGSGDWLGGHREDWGGYEGTVT